MSATRRNFKCSYDLAKVKTPPIKLIEGSLLLVMLLCDIEISLFKKTDKCPLHGTTILWHFSNQYRLDLLSLKMRSSAHCLVIRAQYLLLQQQHFFGKIQRLWHSRCLNRHRALALPVFCCTIITCTTVIFFAPASRAATVPRIIKV